MRRPLVSACLLLAAALAPAAAPPIDMDGDVPRDPVIREAFETMRTRSADADRIRWKLQGLQDAYVTAPDPAAFAEAREKARVELQTAIADIWMATKRCPSVEHLILLSGFKPGAVAAKREGVGNVIESNARVYDAYAGVIRNGRRAVGDGKRFLEQDEAAYEAATWRAAEAASTRRLRLWSIGAAFLCASAAGVLWRVLRRARQPPQDQPKV